MGKRQGVKRKRTHTPSRKSKEKEKKNLAKINFFSFLFFLFLFLFPSLACPVALFLTNCRVSRAKLFYPHSGSRTHTEREKEI